MHNKQINCTLDSHFFEENEDLPQVGFEPCAYIQAHRGFSIATARDNCVSF